MPQRQVLKHQFPAEPKRCTEGSHQSKYQAKHGGESLRAIYDAAMISISDEVFATHR